MNRREFIRTSSVAGAVALGAGHLRAQTEATETACAEQSHPLPAGLSSEAAAGQLLLQLETPYLSFTLFADATARIVDRKSDTEWRMGPVALQDESEIDIGSVWIRTERSICEQYPGRFRGQKEGENIRFWLLGRENHVKGSFLVRITLDGPWLEFRLLEIEERLPSLNFPPPIESASMVLPMHLGRWIRQPIKGRFFYTFYSHLNMRWFGGLDHNSPGQGSGWIAIFPEDNFVDSGVMAAELSASPVWLKSLGRWSEPRAVRYRFVTGSYVDLAMAYREWVIEKGIHRSLTKKLAATPLLANLTQGRLVSMIEAMPRHEKAYDEDILLKPEGDPMLGAGPRISFTHAQAQDCVNKLAKAGVERAIVVVRGWIPGGYDYSHPDIWPPEPHLGSIAELKQLCAGTGGFTVALHDNYQDIYRQSRSWPKGVIQMRSGDRMPGGYWAGGQAYIVNARDGLLYARRNWNSLAQLQLKAVFIDTTTAVQMYQSYEPGNALTRSQDLSSKIDLLRFFKSKGVVLGSEEGADFAAPYLDWNENRHARNAGESIPLWPLVYHDAIVSGRYSAHLDAYMAGRRPAGKGKSEIAAPAWLEDMLWGYALLSYIDNYEDHEAELRHMSEQRQVDAWFRQIGTAAMVDHRFLSSDNTLEQTSFSTGHSITVNFSDEPQSHEGLEIPAYGYRTGESST